MISPKSKVSISKQCEILGLSRTAHYYKAKGESEENLRVMTEMDKEHLEYPAKGVVGMTDHLQEIGYKVGYRRVRRLMRLMGIQAVYRKRSLSVLGQAVYVKPYLLRGLVVDHPNQVWSTDITYIPMRRGFMYLIAIIDVYSRFIVGWGLYNTLDTAGCIEVVENAIARYGEPEILNSDQGCQYTSKEWEEACARHPEMRVSVDGRGRCKDNIWIERFWKTIKYEYINLHPEDNGTDLFFGVRRFIEDYNNHRRHQGIGHEMPCRLYPGNITQTKIELKTAKVPV